MLGRTGFLVAWKSYTSQKDRETSKDPGIDPCLPRAWEYPYELSSMPLVMQTGRF